MITPTIQHSLESRATPPGQPANPKANTNPNTPDATEALIVLTVIGYLLSNPKVLTTSAAASALPPVHHLTVFFEGCGGAGHITGSDLFTADGDGDGGEEQILDSDPVEALLETRIPAGDRESKEGGARIAIGLLLDGAVLTLLDALHPGWTTDEGSEGQVDIRWHRKPDGGVRTVVGGTIGYRSIKTTTSPLWDRGEEATSRRTTTNE